MFIFSFSVCILRIRRSSFLKNRKRRVETPEIEGERGTLSFLQVHSDIQTPKSDVEWVPFSFSDLIPHLSLFLSTLVLLTVSLW